MELDKAIKSRRSIRRYSAQKPDWRDIIECIDSMRYAPKAGNISREHCPSTLSLKAYYSFIQPLLRQRTEYSPLQGKGLGN